MCPHRITQLVDPCTQFYGVLGTIPSEGGWRLYRLPRWLMGPFPSAIDDANRMYNCHDIWLFVTYVCIDLCSPRPNEFPWQGDVLAVARLAGIQGAKQTSMLIPLCHNIFLRCGEAFHGLREWQHAHWVNIDAQCRFSKRSIPVWYIYLYSWDLFNFAFLCVGFVGVYVYLTHWFSQQQDISWRCENEHMVRFLFCC